MSLPATDDPFDLLGLPRTFRIDSAKLRSAYVRRMASVHPDRARSPIEVDDFNRRSAALNEAQRVLADPILRAECLLSLAEGDRSGATGPKEVPPLQLPPDFLMQAMELREALDDAIAANDDTRIAELRGEAVAQREEALAALATAFDEADASGGADRHGGLHRARGILHRLRYVQRFIHAADRREPSDL